MNLSAQQEQRCRHREQTCGHRGEGEDGMNWETGIDIYLLSSIRWIASGKLLCSTGSSVQCSVMT